MLTQCLLLNDYLILFIILDNFHRIIKWSWLHWIAAMLKKEVDLMRWMIDYNKSFKALVLLSH